MARRSFARGNVTLSGLPEITALMRAWGDGDQTALDSLTPLVYGELRRMARRYMRNQRAGHTLQTTALVHEAYLHLMDARCSGCGTGPISSPSQPRSCGEF